MKKYVTKFLALTLLLTFTLISSHCTILNADTYYDNLMWSYTIEELYTPVRTYSTFQNYVEGYSYIEMDKTYVSCSESSPCIVASKEFAFRSDLKNMDGSIDYGFALYVDDKYYDKSNLTVIPNRYYSNGHENVQYLITIRNLTPGLHKILISQLSPSTVTPQKYYPPKYDLSLYVNMLPYEDEHILKSINRINDGTATSNDYSIVGVNLGQYRDNDYYISLLNEQVQGGNLTSSNVQEVVNSKISELNNSLTLADALRRINEGNGTLNDYKTLNITGVTSSNLKQINTYAVQKRTEIGSMLTVEQIQTLVSELPTVLQQSLGRINQGHATIFDYKLHSITKVTEQNLNDVNWYVAGKDNSTNSKLQSNVDKIIKALTNINNGTTVTSNYTTLGISSVTSGNAKIIKSDILNAKAEKGANLTKDEIIQRI